MADFRKVLLEMRGGWPRAPFNALEGDDLAEWSRQAKGGGFAITFFGLEARVVMVEGSPAGQGDISLAWIGGQGDISLATFSNPKGLEEVWELTLPAGGAHPAVCPAVVVRGEQVWRLEPIRF